MDTMDGCRSSNHSYTNEYTTPSNVINKPPSNTVGSETSSETKTVNAELPKHLETMENEIITQKSSRSGTELNSEGKFL